MVCVTWSCSIFEKLDCMTELETKLRIKIKHSVVASRAITVFMLIFISDSYGRVFEDNCK